MRDLTEQLEPYLRAMLEENRNVNLTGIRDLDAARVLHVEDSLAIAALGLAPANCLDLGTGNGFPGVALRFVFPNAGVVLIDRTRKKLDAIGRALASAGIDGVATLHVDAAIAPNTHAAMCGRFELITARALGKPDAVATLAAPFAAPGGNLVLWLDEGTEPPARLPKFKRTAVHEYDLPEPAARHRRLALYTRK